MLFALKIPPGLLLNGTKLQAAGRWFRATLIRFAEGAIRPLGGWQELTASAAPEIIWYGLDGTVSTIWTAGDYGSSANQDGCPRDEVIGLLGNPVTGGDIVNARNDVVTFGTIYASNAFFVDDIPTADYTLSFDYFSPASGGPQGQSSGFGVRVEAGNKSGYYVEFDYSDPGTINLTRYDLSLPNVSDSASIPGYVSGVVERCFIRATGSLIEAGVDDTVLVSFTDTEYTDAGAVSVHLDRYSESAPPPANPVKLSNLQVTTPGDTEITLDGVPRSILGWRGNDGSSSIGIGTNTKWYAHWLGILYDITPSGFTPGDASATVGTGGDSWGDGDWGDGVWGGLGPSQVTFDPPAVWHQDNWGDYLVGCCSPNDGHLYYWDRSPSTVGVVMTNAPSGCTGLVVTPERFMVALAPGGSVRTVQWASQESLTDWSGLGAKATVVLTSDATIPTAGDTVTIGSQTYTFRTALTPTAGEVLINGSAANALTNLKRAVTLTGTAGTDYAAATPSNSLVTATTLTATTLLFEALTAGLAGNSIPSTEASTHLSFPSVTMTGGVDVGTAGDFVLEGKGSIVAARRGKDETLIWTTNELHAMRYIGGTLIYAFSRMGDGCGLIAPGAVAQPDTKSIWMGMRGFFLYDGYVQPVQSEVSDYVFSDFNRTQAGKVTAYTRAQFGEVTWHYPSSGSDENDRYVTLNYRENHWTVGELERTAGCDAGALEFPVCGASNGKLYEHENGWEHLDTDGTTALIPTLEAGPVQLGDGDRVLAVSQLVPDEQNPVGIAPPNLGNVELSLYTSFYPGEDETLHGPFSVRALTDCRFTGRWVRPELTEVVAGDWRFGTLRVDGSPAGRR